LVERAAGQTFLAARNRGVASIVAPSILLDRRWSGIPWRAKSGFENPLSSESRDRYNSLDHPAFGYKLCSFHG
jgi:hypothetical protein